MNPLPPLTFVYDAALAPNGAIILDNSTIELLRCPRLMELKWLRARVPLTDKAGANFGSTIHRGLETRYHEAGVGKLNEIQLIKCQADMLTWLTENPQPESDFRNYDHACKMFSAYLENYPSESFKILNNNEGLPIIENSFLLPFGADINGHPLYYSGKIDLGIEDQNGIWSFDHKTAFQFGQSFDQQMAMDGGQRGYCWALGQVMDKKSQGYIIDAIRVRKPGKKEEYGATRSCIDASDFSRKPVWVTEDDLQEWREDVISLVETIFYHHSNGYFPKHRWQCVNKYGACEFYEVCSCPRSQRQAILDSAMFEPNTWSPLKRNK